MDLEMLRSKMYAKHISAMRLSELTGIKYTSLTMKLNGKRCFSVPQARLVSEALNLTPEESQTIFFN